MVGYPIDKLEFVGGSIVENKIYYFTGTGNSLRAAIKIGKHIKNCTLISMKSNPDDHSAEYCDVVGFIFPVYHWTMPDPAVEFVEKLKINPKAYVFCVAMPSIICGEACEKLEQILKSKGINLSYGTKINNVANYVTVYPPMPSPKIVIPRTEKQLEKIGKEISNRTTRKIPRANAMIRIKIASMRKYKGIQNVADYGFKISKSCISCGVCSRVCPVNNIELINGNPHFKHKCAQCMACVSYCPKNAIGYKLTDKDLEKMNINQNDFKIAKVMGIPKGRKPYHHPNVSASDMSKDIIDI